MNFEIQTCNPQNKACYNNDTKISEAIYTIFPLETEDAILFWGDTDISLSYRYDISIMIDDIIPMMFALQSEYNGKWFVCWPSDTFAADWIFEWHGDALIITTSWYGELTVESYLNGHNVLHIDKQKFLGEWKKIIDILIKNLLECGYSADNLVDMNDLIKASKIINYV